MKHAPFPKLKALHAVFGLDCPYSETERGMAALILDRDDRDPTDPRYGCAYRNQTDMASRAGLKLRTGQRALASLLSRTDGPLVVRRVEQAHRGGSNGRPPNWYSVEFRASVTQNPGKVSRQRDAKPSEGFPAKPMGGSRQTDGGFPATVTHDLSRDLSTDRSTTASQSSARAFVLSNLAQKTERPKKQPGPSKAKSAAKWPGVHQQAVEYYVHAFKRDRGVDPLFGSRDAGAVSKLLDFVAGDLERFKQLVDNGLANWSQATICSIANDPSKALTRSSNGRRQPVQQTGVDVYAGATVIR